MAASSMSPVRKPAAGIFAAGFSGVMPLLAPFSYPRLPADYVSLINSRWQMLAAGAERLPAKLVAAQPQTSGSRSLELKPGIGWRGHKAGQFVNVHVNIDGVWHSRCYSITSGDQRRRRVQITVRAVADGLVSNHLVHSATLGEKLHISQAQGEFILPASGQPAAISSKLFITAGSGITPVMGMLNSLGTGNDCVHVHYERDAGNIMFADTLSDLDGYDDNYQLHHVNTAAGGQHFSSQQLDTLCPDWRQREVWACGPAALLDAVEQHWSAAGLSSRLRTERFQALTAPVSIGSDQTSAGGSAYFAASNISAEGAAGESLLLVAERAGLSPEHGCRMGICHSCDCTLVSGAVRDLRTGQTISQAGVRIQPCVSAAVGSVAINL